MLLDALAQRYGQRPSTLLRGEAADFWLDATVLTIALEEEERRNPKRRPGQRPPPPAPTSREAAATTRNGQFAAVSGLNRYQGKGLTVRSMALPPDGIW